MLMGIAIVSATVGGMLLVYFGMRALMGGDPDTRTSDLAGSVVTRIAALHGLVLALVFASEVVEYQRLATESAREANAIADIYHDAGRYGPEAAAIRSAMRSYVDIVPVEEWAQLAVAHRLSAAAWAEWDTAYVTALDLVPETPRQVALRTHMIAKLHAVAEHRDMRAHHAENALGPMFWAAALVGIVLIAAGYYTVPPKRDNLTLLAIFAGYCGLIFYTIYATSNPYSQPGGLEPVMFHALVPGMSDTPLVGG